MPMKTKIMIFWVVAVCISWVVTIFSEEPVASIFKVEKGGHKLFQTVITCETTQFYNPED
jgi:hypothetical protein